ncbi:5348_t:CDS:1, partial [Racocetra persica]
TVDNNKNKNYIILENQEFTENNQEPDEETILLNESDEELINLDESDENDE